MRLALLTLLAIAAMAGGVLATSHVQRSTADLHAGETALTASTRLDVSRADGALADYALTGDPQSVDLARSTLTHLQAGLPVAREEAADDGIESDAVQREIVRTDEIARWVRADLASATPALRRSALRRDTGQRHGLVEEVLDANAALTARQKVLADAEDRRASLIPALLILVLGLVFGAAAALVARRRRREQFAAERVRVSQERFGEAMQVSESQLEAHRLLKSHLERAIPGTTITVMNRNNSADRLEASTPLLLDSPLELALQHARPRSCMAVRLSRPFDQGPGSEEVLRCELCGVVEARTTCGPLLVGGEVIGAVLAEHHGEPTAVAAERIEQSVVQAAPILANLRNLAIAEMRAATDALTGLPNRRSVDDTLLRMLAQAGRSFTPLSVILLDLDHFKQINDSFGHDRGDEVLAGLGTRLRESLRESDFAGRSGGEEFVLMLPDTDRTGAVRLADKLRLSLAGLSVPGVDRSITASFGIACFPDDAVDAPALLRCADRALYAAKRGGRDRIEASSTGARALEADAEPADGR